MSEKDAKQIDKEFHKKTAAAYDARVDKSSKLYHRLFLYPYIEEAASGLREAGGGKEPSALDIGCGTGSVTIPLAKAGFKVTAVDHSPEMIEIARRKAAGKGLRDKIEFVVGDAEELKFPDGTFDLVACQGVLHHMAGAAGRQRAMKEMLRVMKDRGYLYISEPVEIFPGIKLLSVLGKAYHLVKGEKDIEAPLVKKELLGELSSSGALSFDYFVVPYIPYLPLKAWESIRGAAAKSFKNKLAGSIMFVYGRR